MMALGGGLSSLIPSRGKETAEDLIDKIDSMDDVDLYAEKQPPARKVVVEDDDAGTPPPPAPRAVVVTAEDEETELPDEETEAEPMPSKPLVTPLTIDPDEASPEPDPDTGAEETEQPDSPTAEPEGARTQTVPDEADKKLWETHLGERVEMIALGDVEVNPLQPRRAFHSVELDELARSIDQHGMLQPIVVVRMGGGKYQLLAGERRLRAVKQLGWERVPCVIRLDVNSDRHRLELSLTENVQRQDLNPVEEAAGYKRLNEEYGMTHEEIGERVGRSRVGITNFIRLLQLPVEIQRGLVDGKISIGHARAILMIPDEDKQLIFFSHLIDEGLTVRKAETRARRIQRTMKINDPLRKKTHGRHQLALKHSGQLEDRFGFDGSIKFNEAKNRFEIIFRAYSEGEAETLIGRLMGTQPLPENDEDY